MVVQLPVTFAGQTSRKIISSDLPQLPSRYSINKKKSFASKDMRNMFQRQVDMLEDVRNLIV